MDDDQKRNYTTTLTINVLQDHIMVSTADVLGKDINKEIEANPVLKKLMAPIKDRYLDKVKNIKGSGSDLNH